MRIELIYGTTEGQTKKIAGYAAERFRTKGHEARLHDAAGLDKGFSPAGADRVLILGSLHAGRYQSALMRFVKQHQAELARQPTAFVSVSLATLAEAESEDRKGLEDCVEHFVRDTGWRPGEVIHVAGAFRFSEYDFFKRWIMRRIAKTKGVELHGREDLEMTDWPAFGAALDRWLEKP